MDLAREAVALARLGHGLRFDRVGAQARVRLFELGVEARDALLLLVVLADEQRQVEDEEDEVERGEARVHQVNPGPRRRRVVRGVDVKRRDLMLEEHRIVVDDGVEAEHGAGQHDELVAAGIAVQEVGDDEQHDAVVGEVEAAQQDDADEDICREAGVAHRRHHLAFAVEPAEQGEQQEGAD